MKKAIVLASLLAGLWLGSTAQAQTSIAVDINKAQLKWEWVQGAVPDDGMPSEFRVKCGQTSGNYSKTTVVADPAARSVPVKLAIAGSGQWFCVVTAANQFGESAPTSEVSFLAGTVPVAPSGLGVFAQ